MRTKRSSSSTILMTPMRRGTWACGGFGRRKESFGSQEKAATRNGRLGCGFGGSLARAFGTSSPRGGRADLVAQPQTANAIRTAPKPKPFSFGGILVKLQQTWAALLILATPPSVWQTVLSKRARYSGPRLESDSRTEFNDSQPWQPPAPHPQEGL